MLSPEGSPTLEVFLLAALICICIHLLCTWVVSRGLLDYLIRKFKRKNFPPYITEVNGLGERRYRPQLPTGEVLFVDPARCNVTDFQPIHVWAMPGSYQFPGPSIPQPHYVATPELAAEIVAKGIEQQAKEAEARKATTWKEVTRG